MPLVVVQSVRCLDCDALRTLAGCVFELDFVAGNKRNTEKEIENIIIALGLSTITVY
jgi:hypothetical protein